MNPIGLDMQNELMSKQLNLGGRKYVRVNWTSQEDQMLTNLVKTSNRKVMWAKIARILNSDFHNKEIRIGRQCKKRWFQVLIPLNNIEWNNEKEQKLLGIYNKFNADTKIFYEECVQEMKEYNKDQIKILLENLKEKHQLQRIQNQSFSIQKCENENENSDEPDITKKVKLNDSSIKSLCNALSCSIQ